MPAFTTTYFGNLVSQPESVIEFPLGLPGFENEHRFVLVEQAINRPIVFLQSLSRPDLCFITLPVSLICSTYELCLGSEELGTLGLASPPPSPAGPDVLCLAVVTFSETGPPTANLLSPIVINWRTRVAVQSIPADSPYSHQHPLFASGQEAPCS
jgi:flagellar assembly factor FliW